MTFLTTREFFSTGIFSGPHHVVFLYDIRSCLMRQPFSDTQEAIGKAVKIFHCCRAVQLSKHLFFFTECY